MLCVSLLRNQIDLDNESYVCVKWGKLDKIMFILITNNVFWYFLFYAVLILSSFLKILTRPMWFHIPPVGCDSVLKDCFRPNSVCAGLKHKTVPFERSRLEPLVTLSPAWWHSSEKKNSPVFISSMTRSPFSNTLKNSWCLYKRRLGISWTDWAFQNWPRASSTVKAEGSRGWAGLYSTQ